MSMFFTFNIISCRYNRESRRASVEVNYAPTSPATGDIETDCRTRRPADEPNGVSPTP
jgi:hypothetical protein